MGGCSPKPTSQYKHPVIVNLGARLRTVDHRLDMPWAGIESRKVRCESGRTMEGGNGSDVRASVHLDNSKCDNSKMRFLWQMQLDWLSKAS